MAFWKIYSKIWFKKNIPNMIIIYKNELFDRWYNSLSEEERITYDKYVKKKHDNEILKVKQLLLPLYMIPIPSVFRR